MKSLINYISEKLVINKNYNPYTYVPKSFDELRKIILNRYNKLGPGSKKNPIYFNDIDVSKIDSFFNEDNNTGIFEGTRFKYIDISNWNVSSVKNMNSMFALCERLTSVGDLSGWNVSKVEKMNSVFYGCENLKSVGDLSNWDVSSVKDMYSMFLECEKLTSIGDLSDWNVSNVKDMKLMFFSSAITNIPDWYKK
jgi:surface protein